MWKRSRKEGTFIRASFKYNNHNIVIERGITETKLLIDNKVCEIKKGTFSTQLTNYDLHGEINNQDGSVEKVCVSVRAGLLKDDVVFYCDGKEIEVIQVRA